MPSQVYDPELPVDWISAHPDNPNIGDEESLEESIDEHGFLGAVMVRQIGEWEYQLVAGEHRWKIRKKKGFETVPAIIVEDMTDEAALAYLLADNEVTRRGRYDTAKLVSALRKLPHTRGTGFPMDALEKHETIRAAKAREAKEAQFVREYGIVITVEDEEQQSSLYDQLREVLAIPPQQMRVVSI